MQLESSAIAGIMIPDALTPGQYYDGIRADDSCARPIKRLMLAVLEDAMRCYQSFANSRNRTQRRLFVEAEAWLMDRKADGPFAFETVCETLGIDPSCLREGLHRWRLQQLDGLNPPRLARRSPVTRVGRISAPLKRRRRKPSRAVAGDSGSIAIAVKGNGNGVRLIAMASRTTASVTTSAAKSKVSNAAIRRRHGISAHIEVQQAALA